MRATGETIDPAEIARFAAQAASWWDPAGSFRPLHRLNPARLDFIRRGDHLNLNQKEIELGDPPYEWVYW